MPRLLFVLLAACLLPCRIATAAAESAPLPLGGDAWWLPGAFEPGTQPDGNSLLLRTDAGWIIVDSGRHPAHAERLLAFIADSGLPLHTVINTHWHLDHVSGNPALRAAHPQLQVYASPAIDDALTGFLADYRRQLQGLLDDPARGKADERAAWQAEAARIDGGARLRPDVEVRLPRPLQVGGRAISLGTLPAAATAGDLIVFDRRSNVLAAGDLVTMPVPFLDTACARGWSRSLAMIAVLPFEQLLPGHGRPMDHAAFGRWHQGFDHLLDCAASDASPATCADGWIADLGPLLSDDQHAAVHDMLGYYVTHRLRGPQAARDCPAEQDG